MAVFISASISSFIVDISPLSWSRGLISTLQLDILANTKTAVL